MDPQARRQRRIVTGQRSDGRAEVVGDELLDGQILAEDPDRVDATFFQIWATHHMPVPLSDQAARSQSHGSATTVVGNGSGTAFRIGVLEPGARSPMHRTESLDYGICLEGECDMELDGGDVVTVRAGDVVIQRGTNHVWHNRSTEPCRFAWILVDASFPTVAGQRHETSWQTD